MKAILTIALLILSNSFMTLAWYGHLRYKHSPILQSAGIASIVIVSWGIAFFEYIFQVPANRIGFHGTGGPFSLMQLKVIQEVISLSVFTVFAILVFRNETLRWNHFVGFLFLVLAVFFIFRK